MSGTTLQHAAGARRRTLLGWLGGGLASAAAGARAQTSAAPLRVILPVGPGSGVDTIVRSAQNALARAMGGRGVVIENLPGAGGITGTQAIVNAAPDGNTIGVVSNNHVVNPSVYKKLPYDSLADITPISVVGNSPFVWVVNPQVPAKNARELQAWLKAKPGAYNYGSSGNGTIIHLAGAMLVEALGADVKHIPYKGMAPMLTDIMSGQIQMGAGAVPAVQGHLQSGALRAIGMMGKSRVPALPDLPTFAEQGYPDVDVDGWFAVVGPAKLPADAVQRIHDAVVAAFADAEVKAAMARQQNIIAPTTPEQAARYFRTEEARYAALVKKIGLTVD